jgi:hypothetical protein
MKRWGSQDAGVRKGTVTQHPLHSPRMKLLLGGRKWDGQLASGRNNLRKQRSTICHSQLTDNTRSRRRLAPQSDEVVECNSENTKKNSW